LPSKLVGARAAGSQVKPSAPEPFPRERSSVPSVPRYHDRGVVPGSGQRENERSKAGTGAPGADPAPFSNRMRTGGWASKAASASS
jgi:hypothetical protein